VIRASSETYRAPGWLTWAKRNNFVRLTTMVAARLIGESRSPVDLGAATFKAGWIVFWMRCSGPTGFGRLATRLAGWLAPPYRARRFLALLSPTGYVSPTATIYHSGLKLGPNVFVDEQVVIFQGGPHGGPVELGENVTVYRGSFLETGEGGSLSIGADTTIHAGCQLMAYKAPIQIGRGVGLAQNCALYPYDHGAQPGESIHEQPLETRGGIIIEDGAWLGTGAIVLSGVRIGKGAVVGAGSVVWRDVPDGAVATGAPARVVKMRGDGIGSAGEERR
jgi:acetyltransferase-like isoleucine patch superfamily enzyme